MSGRVSWNDANKDSNKNNYKLISAIASKFKVILDFKPKNVATKITAIYIFFGSSWILFSDKLVAKFIDNKDTITLISMIKGWIYVIVTGLLVYYMILNSMKKIHELNSELEERVLTRTNALVEVNRELEAYNYTISHDLRAPLRGINGFSNLLYENCKDNLDTEGMHCIQRILELTIRMSEMIDDLLNLSKLGREDIVSVEVDLSELVRVVCEQVGKSQPKRNVEFKIKEETKAYGDKNLLQIVFENLIGNSWKFTSKHSHAKIEFGTLVEENRTVYYIRDDGAGFDMKYADKLFGTFQRLHTVSEFEGNGIGLANVQRIIKRHGGEIWAESVVEKGATFYFTLG